MEASQAGAEAAPAEAQEGAEGQEVQQQAPEQNLSEDVLKRIDELGESIAPMREAFENFEPEGEEGQEAPDLLNGQSQELYDAYGNPVGADGQPLPEPGEIDPEALQGFIQQEIQKGIETGLKPLYEQQQEQRIVQEAEKLETEFTELADPQVAEKVVTEARGVAEQMGNPELAGDPAFIRLTYLAGKAEQQAAQETPAGTTQGVELEGGAGPAPSAGEGDTAMEIVQAGRPRGVLGGLA